jgi:hypothetical protein
LIFVHGLAMKQETNHPDCPTSAIAQSSGQAMTDNAATALRVATPAIDIADSDDRGGGADPRAASRRSFDPKNRQTGNPPGRRRSAPPGHRGNVVTSRIGNIVL